MSKKKKKKSENIFHMSQENQNFFTEKFTFTLRMHLCKNY